MRTEPPSPMASALARLRSPIGRTRRWLAARGPATRIGLLLVALAALGAVGYFSSLEDPGERAWAWLYEGRKLSSDDLNRISETLDAADIPHVADPSGRVGVKPARRTEALEALAKAKVVPRTLDDLSRDLEVGGLLEGPEERQRRELARLERSLKYQIEGLDASISSAHVEVIRTRARSGMNAPWNVSAYVYLRTEGGRRLGNRVVEGIETFLKGTLPDLRPEAITVADQSGYKYLAAGNPSLKEEMKTHALEETWREKIAEELQHIPGVGVSVLLETVPAPPPPPEVPPPGADELVKPNGSVVIDPEPPLDASASTAHPTRTKANVWVRVPRSFYLLEFQSRSPSRQPSQEDLEPMRVTTEKLIHDAVEIHIPKDDLGVVKIGVIQDDLVASRPLLVPSVPEAHRPWAWAALSGAIALASVAAIAALVRLATRRPSARPSRSAWRPGFVADGPSGPVPGPSERVRELIRLNPEAAAGVLQRWIGQGGALP
jgi:flagellar M-ring protein FliF